MTDGRVDRQTDGQECFHRTLSNVERPTYLYKENQNFPEILFFLQQKSQTDINKILQLPGIYILLPVKL